MSLLYRARQRSRRSWEITSGWARAVFLPRDLRICRSLIHLADPDRSRIGRIRKARYSFYDSRERDSGFPYTYSTILIELSRAPFPPISSQTVLHLFTGAFVFDVIATAIDEFFLAVQWNFIRRGRINRIDYVARGTRPPSESSRRAKSERTCDAKILQSASRARLRWWIAPYRLSSLQQTLLVELLFAAYQKLLNHLCERLEQFHLYFALYAFRIANLRKIQEVRRSRIEPLKLSAQRDDFIAPLVRWQKFRRFVKR